MANGFLDIEFPRMYKDGATGGPTYSTSVTTAANGREQRVQQWSTALRRWSVDIGNKTYADFALLRDFFMTVRGQAYDFRFWDWSDNALVTEYQATGDGATTFFPVLKTYGASFGANNEVRRIYKPAAGLVVFLQDTEAGSPLQAITGSGPVTVSGVSFGPSDYHIDTMNGYIAFGKAVPSGVNIFVSGSFWSVCRLGNDAMLGTMVNSQIFTWGQISIVEVPFSAAATPQ